MSQLQNQPTLTTTEQSQQAFQQLKETVSQKDHEFRMRQLNVEEEKLKVEEGKLKVEEGKLDLRRSELIMQSRQLGQKLMMDAEEVDGVLLKQTLRDAGLSLMSPSSQSETGEIYYDVPRILSEMGISMQNSSKMGRLIAGRYRVEFKEEPKKQEKVVSGSMRVLNVYPKSKIAIIKSWLNE